jgi:hypothetical protein
MAGAETWPRMILNAIERLQAKAPHEGERGYTVSLSTWSLA